MSFRVRIVLMTTTLICILFSIGGAVLVHTTFQASMQKEEQEAVDNNELVLKIVQIVGEDGEWFSEDNLISVLSNISEQETNDMLILTCEEETIYTYKKNKTQDISINAVNQTEENQVLITYFDAENGEKYLQTTTHFSLNQKVYYLDMVRNLSVIYQVREEQIAVFQKTFLVITLLGLIISWILALFLTRPLSKLTKAAKEIGAGNLTYRTKIKSDDEIGTLSIEFDKMADKLEENITLLKESAEQKDMFMGAFTHEMKTPMTSIIGYADLLRSQKLSESDEEDALEFIFTEAKRLENMSLKMLDLFVADKKEMALKLCSPAHLAEYVVRHLQHTYDDFGIQLQLEVEEGTCMLEPDLFQTLVINLLDNAKKAMEQGGMIQIGVRMLEMGCRISVKDTGKGIPKEALKHITEAFYRVDKTRARQAGSAGLGLALCDKIVQLHHGTMQFESEVGAGTTVTVSLNGGRREK